MARIIHGLELAAMVLIITNDGPTTPEVVNILCVTRRVAQKLLSRLIEKGMIERTGVARSTRYRLTARVLNRYCSSNRREVFPEAPTVCLNSLTAHVLPPTLALNQQ